jgi:hypothetical protein
MVDGTKDTLARAWAEPRLATTLSSVYTKEIKRFLKKRGERSKIS